MHAFLASSLVRMTSRRAHVALSSIYLKKKNWRNEKTLNIDFLKPRIGIKKDKDYHYSEEQKIHVLQKIKAYNTVFNTGFFIHFKKHYPDFYTITLIENKKAPHINTENKSAPNPAGQFVQLNLF